MHIAIACGGTGGHIYPGMATGEALLERGHRVTLWLGDRGVESMGALEWAGELERMRASGFPRGLRLSALRAAWQQLIAVRHCRQVLRRDRPDALLGMGSYASVPPVLAARMLGIPCLLHESNAVPGRAVSMLARFADGVALGFEGAAKDLRAGETRVTGFPLRRAFVDATAALTPAAARTAIGLDPDRWTLLIMCGSQGALAVNEAVADAVLGLGRDAAPQVIHVAGKGKAGDLAERYGAAGISALVDEYRTDMPRLYAAADLAVCRAGSATCAETGALGLRALLVPHPGSIRGHQQANAAAMVAAGRADTMDQSDLTRDRLQGYLLAQRDTRRVPPAAPADTAASALADYVETVATRQR